MFRFSILVDNLNAWSGKIFFFIMPLIALIGTYEVTMRYLFNRPTNWAWEVNSSLLCVACAMGAGYALVKGTHVRVDVVYNLAPMRVKAIMDSVTAVFAIGFLGVLIWQGAGMSWYSILVRETTKSVFRSPVYPFKAIIVIGTSLFLLQVLANLVRNIYTAYTGKSVGLGFEKGVSL
ncbi:hypothetical protein ES703_33105 [subsurface metagenome]